MKTLVVLLILFCVIALPALGELTDADLDKIRLIVKEEVKTEIAGVRQELKAEIAGVRQELKAEIAASETRTREHIDLKIDAVNKSLGRVWLIIVALIGLITATIAIPQIIIAYRDRGQKEMERSQQALQTEIQQLRERLEALENTPS